LKNILLVDAHATICYLSTTYEGSVHDKRITDECNYPLPHGAHLFQDKGFQGFAPPFVTVHQPTKKSKDAPLSDDQRAANRAIAQKRMRVEHVIASLKRLRLVKDKLRLWKADVCDHIIQIAAALHNFRLSFRPWPFVSLYS